MVEPQTEHIVVETEMAAPPWRVWRALTDVDEVQAWDGARAVAWSDDYPTPGEHARWRIPVGAWSVVLHDRVAVVEPPDLLASHLSWLWVHIDEEYRLEVTEDGTRVVSDNCVRTRPNWGWLRRRSARTVEQSVRGAMARLRDHCEAG